MSRQLAYERLNVDLVAAIPALSDVYRREVDWWGSQPIPSHVLFGEILNPYISSRLAASDSEALVPAFQFLERMAADVDPRVQDVLRDTVLEHLREEPPTHQLRAEDLMGPATSHHWHQLS